MKENISIPSRPKRKFVPENLNIDSWNKVEPLFENLLKEYKFQKRTRKLDER